MKQTKVLTTKKELPNLDKCIKKMVGKKVLAHNNEVVGKVIDVVYKAKTIEGILVKGKKVKTFIEYNYIKDQEKSSIFLNIDPVTRYLGMIVFDNEGNKLGKVIEIEQTENKNELKNIIVKKNIFSKKITIDSKKIDIATKNIVLKEEKVKL